MAQIHPTALVAAGAELAADVEIGPFAVIGPQVCLGNGTTVGAHTVIEGRTTIGRNNRIAAHAALGGPPQDKKYAGEDTRLEIGEGNTIREFCTINTGTAQDLGYTRIGSHNWIMAYAHIAHDCVVGDNTIFANAASLAGHVHIGDWVILGGFSGVHQFVKMGPHAMSAAGSIVLRDVPPFVMCSGNPAQPHGLNTEGLKRRGFSAEAIALLRRAYKAVYREGLTVADAAQALAEMEASAPEHAEHVAGLRRFVQESKRGIAR